MLTFIYGHRTVRIAFKWLSLVAVCVTGCGPSGDGALRIPISGYVRIGKVLATDGHVRFVPSLDNTGPVASAAIKDGRYEFSTLEGPTKGAHDVYVEVRLKAQPANSTEGPRTGAKGGGETGAVQLKTTVLIDPGKTVVDLQFEEARQSAPDTKDAFSGSAKAGS